MKRFPNPFNIIFIAAGIMFLTSGICYAGILDTIKGWSGSIGWEAAAYAITALLAIGGFAARAKWLSALFLVVQTTFACVATLFEVIGSVFGWAGSALQDGKLSSDEIKQAPGMIKQAKESIKQTWSTVRAAWGSLNND